MRKSKERKKNVRFNNLADTGVCILRQPMYIGMYILRDYHELWFLIYLGNFVVMCHNALRLMRVKILNKKKKKHKITSDIPRGNFLRF